MDLQHTVFGMWNGGHFLHFGEDIGAERLKALVRKSYDLGIRTFITADVYGEGESDRIAGEVLSAYPRDSYCLVGGIGHDFIKGQRDGEKGFPRFTDPGLRPASEYESYIRTSVEESLKRCRTDHFDLVFLHNPDQTGYESPVVWDAMARLKAEGKTRMLGLAPGPANGFTLDIIQCFEKYGERIDWAMIILNPLEPWPGSYCFAAAKKHSIKVLTRVVDYGGLFHGYIRPGHRFGRNDHRSFRPAGWVEEGLKKIDQMRPIAERHNLSLLHLACQWTMGHDPVEAVVPTLLQEAGPDAKPVEAQLEDLAKLPAKKLLSPEEVAAITKIGDNKGCMQLKGASRQYSGPPQGDQWAMTPQLEEVARRWNFRPDRDFYFAGDPRDMREKGLPIRGEPQLEDRRLFIQLQCFTGANGAGALVEAMKKSQLECVLYSSANDPHGVGVLVLSENENTFVTTARDLFNSDPFQKLVPVPAMTMFGRTYGGGREPDLRDWLLDKPRRNAMNGDCPWAIWYPLRRKGAFYRLPDAEKGKILFEHGMIGRNYGNAGLAFDIRLECFGMDPNDNEFVIGLVGPRLHPLSKLIADMRPTTQTSEYMDKLGPFFVGKAIWQSGVKGA